MHADFFALAADPETGFDASHPARLADVVLLDIDHSPRHWLNTENGGFYTPDGLRALTDKLSRGGLFGLWSNDPPDEPFEQLLESIFDRQETHVVSFPNPYQGGESSCTVYLAFT